ncbi:MAG: class I SAM-dependent methyltransferase [Nitrospirae bacterium]|nr:class I SAM-dependent methyltransferase [Nitrospirota bacterium]
MERINLKIDDYDKWFDSTEGKAFFQSEAAAVRLLMKGLKPPFLEIGVGTGRFARELEIDFGIDPSVKMLSMAMTRGIKTKNAEGESLPFPDNSFGVVFIFFTLCFVRDPEKVLAESKRVLKPDGGLIIGFINRESTWGELYLKKKSEGHPIYKYARFFSEGEISGLLKKTGFSAEAYSSTLRRKPSDTPLEESAHSGLSEEAGFICILARNCGSSGASDEQ